MQLGYLNKPTRYAAEETSIKFLVNHKYLKLNIRSTSLLQTSVLFTTRHNSRRILLRLHCHADPRRMAWSAIWRDAGIRDLSGDCFCFDYADPNSSKNKCRSSDNSQGDRGAGFGKCINYYRFEIDKREIKNTITIE